MHKAILEHKFCPLVDLYILRVYLKKISIIHELFPPSIAVGDHVYGDARF